MEREKDLQQEIDVVGAVIRNPSGEVLCALRSQTMSTPAVWEFPGGKIEPGEDPRSTLRREIEEELGCHIEVENLIEDVRHPNPHRVIRLRTYEARLTEGAPNPTEHARCLWLPVSYLHSLVWAPPDVSTVKRLQREQHPSH